jgi:hypothetical protein
MITTPTTFVVGAGASRSYGLPLASGLRATIAGLAPSSDLYQLVAAVTRDVGRINEFLENLRAHPATSIDAFLESQMDEKVQQLGKALMGVAMAAALLQPAHTGDGDDWLSYIIEEMRQGARTFPDFAKGNAGVRFVTFNFDSVIEDRLTNAAKAIYKVSDDEASNIVPIIHVHGRLPALPAGHIGKTAFGDLDDRWVKWTRQAAEGINVVLDAIDEQTFTAARSAVRDAAVLCFLGFAYYRDNLLRLEIPNCLRDQEVFGSAFNLMAGEQARVKDRFGGRIHLGQSHQKCLEILRAFKVFRD